MSKKDRIYYDKIAEYTDIVFDLHNEIATQKNRAKELYPEQASPGDIQFLEELEEAVRVILNTLKNLSNQ